MTSNKSTSGGTKTLFGFWVFWTSIIGVINVVFAVSIVRQFWSLSYMPVDATLLEKSLEGDDDSFKAHVKYSYSVAGRDYVSELLDWSDTGSGDKHLIECELPKAEVGEQVTAWYSPDSPETSVLNRWPQPIDLLLPLFLLPFNSVSLVGLLLIIDRWRGRALGRTWLQTRVRDSFEGLECRFYAFDPLMGATVAAGATGFVMTFVVFFTPHTLLAGYSKVISGWSVILAVVLAAWHYARRSGSTLRIDLLRGRVHFVASPGQAEESHPLEDVAAVSHSESTKVDSEGSRTTTAALALDLRDGNRLPLITLNDSESALRLRAWLMEQLHLSP